mmetsp:Transcript_29361/g.63849  ORF Transcript_29361/g.63849 Transcript_29361/m.63849 type:complete len:104 (+) Transcript_29361:1-312(+)
MHHSPAQVDSWNALAGVRLALHRSQHGYGYLVIGFCIFDYEVPIREGDVGRGFRVYHWLEALMAPWTERVDGCLVLSSSAIYTLMVHWLGGLLPWLANPLSTS